MRTAQLLTTKILYNVEEESGFLYNNNNVYIKLSHEEAYIFNELKLFTEKCLQKGLRSVIGTRSVIGMR